MVRNINDNTYSVVTLDSYYDNIEKFYPVIGAESEQDAIKLKNIVNKFGEKEFYKKVSGGKSPRQKIVAMLCPRFHRKG